MESESPDNRSGFFITLCRPIKKSPADLQKTLYFREMKYYFAEFGPKSIRRT